MSLKKHTLTIFWILIGITLFLALLVVVTNSPSRIHYTAIQTEHTNKIPSHIQATSSELTILIGGDIMLDRSIRRQGDKHGYDSLFTDLIPLFKQSDIIVANLEGPITSSSSKTLLANGSTSKSFAFTFATSTGELLARIGISFVSLANNHTDNFGIEGFNETQDVLTRAGVGYFGNPWNASSTEATVTKHGIPVAFVGYHQFQPGFSRILSDVERLSHQGYFVIVMPHWGTEYATTSSVLQQKQARELITAGAGAIIGSHPHVIQEYEMIEDVPVYYSLGNLLFDQYFSADVMKGNVIKLQIVKDATHIKIMHTTLYETLLTRTGVTVTGATEY